MSLFLGLGFGQLLFGPLSDRIGRKPAIHAGLVLFMVGCLVSIFAPTFEVMIAGRVLQGVGVAGPRIVIIALVRDQYEGRMMARLMSFAHGRVHPGSHHRPGARPGPPHRGRLARDIHRVPRHRRDRLRVVCAAPAGNPARCPTEALLAACHRPGRGRDTENSARARLHAGHGVRLRAFRRLSRLGPNRSSRTPMAPARSSRSISGSLRFPSAAVHW